MNHKISRRDESRSPSGIAKERNAISFRGDLRRFSAKWVRLFFNGVLKATPIYLGASGQIPPLALMASSIYISARWNPLYEVSPPLLPHLTSPSSSPSSFPILKPHPNLKLPLPGQCSLLCHLRPPPRGLDEGSSGVKLSHSRSTKRNRKSRFPRVAILAVSYDPLSLRKYSWEAFSFDSMETSSNGDV